MCEAEPGPAGFKPFIPPVSFQAADRRAEGILSQLTLEEKMQLIGGHHKFFIKGFKKLGIPDIQLTDATQGVHLVAAAAEFVAKQPLEKSTAFPCPLLLTATWNRELAGRYAQSIGEECRAGGLAILLGPGMNIYRISQNGRNFEYFGEDPWLTARFIENYVTGVQSTGTIATLKHFVANNSDFHRRTSDSVVDERTLHEIYLPAFQAGIEAGALAVMTSYNRVNGEWAGQSSYVINQLLRRELGFRWLVMTDWWSVWDPEKVIKSGQDLDMPGDAAGEPALMKLGDHYVRNHAPRLVAEGRVSEAEIDRMAKSILRTCIAMGFHDRPVQDTQYLSRYPEHEAVALQTAREGIVLLRNEDHCLPIDKNKINSLLVTGEYVTKIPKGGGSADVVGYNQVTLLAALVAGFGDKVVHAEEPSGDQLQAADVVILSIGTADSEAWDRSFALPEATEAQILKLVQAHPRVVVVVNAGGGIKMTGWHEKTAAILYAWYPGQIGNVALVEILAGKVNPSGRLPITIERRFEDSPGYGYLPAGEALYTGWEQDLDMQRPIHTVEYKEGVFVGYRWYEARQITPLYPFGFGLSYTGFTYNDLTLTPASLKPDETLTVSFTLTNTGNLPGQEVAQLYLQDVDASVPRPVKELKGFAKVLLQPGESRTVRLTLTARDFAFWDVKEHKWLTEPGEFRILVGANVSDIRLRGQVTVR
jgi:beta-glucosidase